MELLFFLLGILFVSYVIPILDSLSTLILAWVETKKIAYSEQINQTNIKMRRDAEKAEEEDYPKKTIVGFYAPDDDADYTEEEDDENEV